MFKIHTKEFLAADNDKVEKEKAEKILEWTKKAPSQHGKSPRAEKKIVQQFYCICFQSAEPCNCAVGPSIDIDSEMLPEWEEEWRSG